MAARQEMWMLLALFLCCSATHATLGEASDQKELYVVYLGSSSNTNAEVLTALHHDMLVDVLGSPSAAQSSVVYSYTHNFNGFAAMLSSEEFALISGMQGVVSVFRSRSYQLHTTRTWNCLGFLSPTEGIWPATNFVHDLIVGSIDTGVWPEADSFRDDEALGPIPAKWKGICQEGQNFTASHCNRKLVGVQYFLKAYEAQRFGDISCAKLFVLVTSSLPDRFVKGANLKCTRAKRPLHWWRCAPRKIRSLAISSFPGSIHCFLGCCIQGLEGNHKVWEPNLTPGEVGGERLKLFYDGGEKNELNPFKVSRFCVRVLLRFAFLAVFNQRSLYNAYKKRTKNVEVSFEEYVKAREADPDFYRDGASLQYGKQIEIPEENINRMVKELEDRGKSRKEFSLRRKFHDERGIDSINDRNEHFNSKIERAFGKYTLEIKNNLERGRHCLTKHLAHCSHEHSAREANSGSLCRRF